MKLYNVWWPPGSPTGRILDVVPGNTKVEAMDYLIAKVALVETSIVGKEK